MIALRGLPDRNQINLDSVELEFPIALLYEDVSLEG